MRHVRRLKRKLSVKVKQPKVYKIRYCIRCKTGICERTHHYCPKCEKEVADKKANRHKEKNIKTSNSFDELLKFSQENNIRGIVNNINKSEEKK